MSTHFGGRHELGWSPPPLLQTWAQFRNPALRSQSPPLRTSTPHHRRPVQRSQARPATMPTTTQRQGPGHRSVPPRLRQKVTPTPEMNQRIKEHHINCINLRLKQALMVNARMLELKKAEIRAIAKKKIAIEMAEIDLRTASLIQSADGDMHKANMESHQEYFLRDEDNWEMALVKCWKYASCSLREEALRFMRSMDGPLNLNNLHPSLGVSENLRLPPGNEALMDTRTLRPCAKGVIEDPTNPVWVPCRFWSEAKYEDGERILLHVPVGERRSAYYNWNLRRGLLSVAERHDNGHETWYDHYCFDDDWSPTTVEGGARTDDPTPNSVRSPVEVSPISVVHEQSREPNKDNNNGTSNKNDQCAPAKNTRRAKITAGVNLSNYVKIHEHSESLARTFVCQEPNVYFP